jgi:ribosomal protein S12
MPIRCQETTTFNRRAKRKKNNEILKVVQPTLKGNSYKKGICYNINREGQIIMK